MRVVLDTNILVSAAIKPHSRIASYLRSGTFILLTSNATLQEFITVLNRPHLREKYQLTPHYIHAYLGLLKLHSEQVNPVETIVACRDPKDDKFLELAITGRANALVTRDEGLLVVHPLRGIPIVTPDTFWRLLSE